MLDSGEEQMLDKKQLPRCGNLHRQAPSGREKDKRKAH